MQLLWFLLSFGSPITTCSLPSDADIVPVGANGWAMSPDEPCIPGKYCPYACPPGKVMNQWDQEATSYAFPKSMNGGLYCNDDGSVSVPLMVNHYVLMVKEQLQF